VNGFHLVVLASVLVPMTETEFEPALVTLARRRFKEPLDSSSNSSEVAAKVTVFAAEASEIFFAFKVADDSLDAPNANEMVSLLRE
jgi:hypothetical protein